MTTILERYRSLHPRSAQLHSEARGLFPDGVTHDTRRLLPFPLYVREAQGCLKWDVDGNEIIDYVMGHGALLLGHCHPDIVAAVREQVGRGTHYGACHELEVRWAQSVQRLIPSAQRLRFTSSGTEATHMALRLARAYTGKDRVVKLEGHFHGWHDNLIGTPTADDPVPRAPGVPRSTSRNLIVIPPNDAALLEPTLAADSDIAAVIVEPTGASWGTIPLAPGYLEALRDVTQRYGVALIFDEVITGFRVSPGGAQARYNVLPDLTCLAKVMCGGLPGGAVAGRADIMTLIEFRDDPEWNSSHRMAHPGTFNANPLSAAAGTTGLAIVAQGDVHRHADGMTRRLVEGMNRALEELRAPGCAYALASIFHIALGQDYPRPRDGVEWPYQTGLLPSRMPPQLAMILKRALLNEGVDLMGGSGGFVSIAHGPADIDATISAFQAAVAQMQRERIIQ
ncbi:MAG TPA: aspartate aminotransferase family protein [Dehalococcoidia bacterium]|nr:aspartate aminotransferase family protein [Dehalococcoidia bacterium]